MDNHHHHALGHGGPPLHWGTYSTAVNPAATSWAPSPRSAKRPLSESDDGEEIFSEESSKEPCTSPGDADSCQMLSRKKRRGVIEKKRRDRINTSLSELKRLVPSAFEKQGSAKLEKAEILQLTVDHLKTLHAKGLDALAYDPHKYAMDYHGMGFRECVAEVIRYLERIEGLDMQNPLRLRLTSHLQCCAAQRELASKQAAAPTPWSYTSQSYPPLNSTLQPSPVPNHAPPPPIGNLGLHHHHQHHHQEQQHQQHQQQQQGGPPPPPPPGLHHQHLQHELSSFDIITPCTQTSTSSIDSSSAVRLTPLTTLTPLSTSTTPSSSSPSSLGYTIPHQYPSTNAFTIPTSSHHQNNYNPNGGNSQGMKPYRPWGAEVAY